ncbi:Rubredoxin [Micractinium conductrix]|uniref:Rubredoxin n=1 Tax=Micractinium conductrix TaxID=554055 RepID=A0A2P6VL59_9CHLO|nr:Rubredoxin [Micractinium conductrix]|eukprot:PSC74856.1 Rubredoxin [Micractinium conductrix]
MQSCAVQQRSLAGASAAAFRPRSRAPQRAARAVQLRLRAEAEEQQAGGELENPESEAARKKAEADRLRAAEKFMTVGTGEASCKGCGYEYSPKRGDPEYPVAPGTQFQQLPADWQCPVCGAEKKLFVSKQRQVAGFAENQGYGLGTNSMTEGDKSLLIFGSLAFFFVLFLAGYALP